MCRLRPAGASSRRPPGSPLSSRKKTLISPAQESAEYYELMGPVYQLLLKQFKHKRNQLFELCAKKMLAMAQGKEVSRRYFCYNLPGVLFLREGKAVFEQHIALFNNILRAEEQVSVRSQAILVLPQILRMEGQNSLQLSDPVINLFEWLISQLLEPLESQSKIIKICEALAKSTGQLLSTFNLVAVLREKIEVLLQKALILLNLLSSGEKLHASMAIFKSLESAIPLLEESIQARIVVPFLLKLLHSKNKYVEQISKLTFRSVRHSGYQQFLSLITEIKAKLECEKYLQRIKGVYLLVEMVNGCSKRLIAEYQLADQLLSCSRDPVVKIRLLVASVLESLKDRGGSPAVFEENSRKLLEDPEVTVRQMAALALQRKAIPVDEEGRQEQEQRWRQKVKKQEQRFVFVQKHKVVQKKVSRLFNVRLKNQKKSVSSAKEIIKFPSKPKKK